MTVSSLEIEIEKVRDDGAGMRSSTVADQVAAEEPLEIRLGFQDPSGYTAKSVSITMRTPGNDDELAAGFLYTEGIVDRQDAIVDIAHCGPPAPDSGNVNVVRVDLEAHVPVDIGRLQRNFYTTSSCGVCGKSSLDALHALRSEPLADGAFQIARSALIDLPNKLRVRQRTFDTTGGLHAAAAFNSRGDIVLAREDVGRHNAVDKVIGALLLGNTVPAANLGLMVSGRASFELVQKALMADMPMLAAVSAPSSLAVRLAREFNVTLVGFLRGRTYNIYTGGDRINP